MNLEENIKDVISQKLQDGTIEKLIGEQLEKGVMNALESLFRSYGDLTKLIEEQIKSVMVPYLEDYDYSKYILKLDSVLVDVLKNSTVENKNLLENFKTLMIVEDKNKEINMSELFTTWIKYVAKNVDTSDLEVQYEDGVSYENVQVRFEVQYDEDRDWGSFKYATLVFECEQDEEMNFAVRLTRYDKDKSKGWEVRYDGERNIRSLRHLNSFELLLMKLDQNGTKIVLDEDSDSDDVTPDKEPEASYN